MDYCIILILFFFFLIRDSRYFIYSMMKHSPTCEFVERNLRCLTRDEVRSRRDKRARRPVSRDDLPDEGYLNEEARREHGGGWMDGWRLVGAGEGNQ